jgi:hypothetical protein
MWIVRYNDGWGVHHELRRVNTHDMNILVRYCVELRYAVAVEWE